MWKTVEQQIHLKVNEKFSRAQNSQPHHCLYARQKRRSSGGEGLVGKEPAEGKDAVNQGYINTPSLTNATVSDLMIYITRLSAVV